MNAEQRKRYLVGKGVLSNRELDRLVDKLETIIQQLRTQEHAPAQAPTKKKTRA